MHIESAFRTSVIDRLKLDPDPDCGVAFSVLNFFRF